MMGETVARDALSSRDREAMFAILDRHFVGVEPAVFDADLEEKNWIILLRDDEGKLLGFSTLLLYRTHVGDETLRVVYSGDTIIDSSAWGSFALPKTWIEAIWSLHSPESNERLMWLLITSGFRTYRFLPVFLRNFYPHFRRPTPTPTAQLMQRLAHERFGPDYDPATGTVVFDKPQALRGSLASIPDGKRANPHIDYFARANPGWTRGDELVCLGELSRSNLTRAGQRMLDPCEATSNPLLGAA